MSVHYESDGPITVVTIDRPEVANAIDAPTALELADAFRRFETDESVSVAVLTGANGTFCAGADSKAPSRTAQRPAVLVRAVVAQPGGRTCR